MFTNQQIEMSETNLNLEFCYTCLKVGSDEDKFLRVDYTPVEDISFKNKLKSCVPEMSMENMEDCYLCKPCSVALETAYTFRCMCIRSKSKLEEFKAMHRERCGIAQKNIKLEIIEAMCTEEISIEPEQKYQINNTEEFDDLQEPLTQPGEEESIDISTDTEDCLIPENNLDNVEIVEIEDISSHSPQLSEKIKKRDTKIDAVKDELGDLLSESLGNTIDISIRISGNSSNTPPAVNSEINIFNSLNKEIEELTKITSHSSQTKCNENVKREIKLQQENKKKELIKYKFPEKKIKKTLSDAELIANACKTIPELHNCPVQSLECQVSLEKITVTELPVIIHSNTQGKNPKQNVIEKKKKAHKGVRRYKGEQVFWCNFCSKNYTRRDRYTSHILKHSNIRAYKCKLCLKGFFSGDTLNKHKKNCNGIASEPTTSGKFESNISEAENNADATSSKFKLKQKGLKNMSNLKQKSPKKNSFNTQINSDRQLKFKVKIRKSQRKQTFSKRLCNLTDAIFSCELCHYQCYQKQRFEVHMMKHSNDRRFQCEKCPKKYFERWELNRHMRTTHAPIQGKGILKNKFKKNLERKLKVKAVEKPIINEETENLFEDDNEPSLLEPAITLSIDHGIVMTPFIQSFHSLADSPQQDPLLEMSYSCKKCNISFKSRNLLLLHTQTHEWSKYKCKMCKQEFINEMDLSHHMSIHTSVNEEIIAQSAKSSLHTDVSPKLIPKKKKKKKFFCTVCNLEFACRDHANVHTGAKPYQCKYCGKHFAAYSTLRKHRLTHENQNSGSSGTSKQTTQTNPQRKKFTCDSCKVEFTKQEQLFSHICQTVSGETIYRCQICRNAFLGRSALIEHMGLHVSQSSE